jgi:hypothetical protein
MTTVFLPVGSLLYVDTSATDTPSWQKLTEHNRQPASIQINRIEKHKEHLMELLESSLLQIRRVFLSPGI